MTTQFAETKARPFKALGGLMPNLIPIMGIVVVLEFIVGIYLATQHSYKGIPCGVSGIVVWLLIDGGVGMSLMPFGYFKTKKLYAASADPELQTYLIHRDRDGTVDPDMETKAEDLQPSFGPMRFMCPMLMVGIYLYFSTPSQGCDALSRTCLGWLLVARPCIGIFTSCCVTPLIMKKMQQGQAS